MLSAKLNTKQLDKILNKIPAYRLAAKKRVDDALATHALLIATDAKLLSPVDTGFNRASIQVVKEDYAKYKVVANTQYAIFLEFGTLTMQAQPFLFPAYEKNRPALLAALREALKFKL